MASETMADLTTAAESQERAAMWAYIWVMVGFKVVTLAIILYYTREYAAVWMLVALHIPWIVGALLLLGVPGAFWYRLLKARARRAELIRQEFHVEQKAAA